MATDGPTPSPCNREIYKDGKLITVLTGPSNAIEMWVKRVAEASGVPTDWYYAGGRAQVLFLGGDAEGIRLRNTMEQLLPALSSKVQILQSW